MQHERNNDGQANGQQKNMLNSFRNGPIKVMNNASFVRNDYNMKPTGQPINARPAPNKSGQPRPASAPAKRPQSPNQSATNTSQTQNRTKYSKLFYSY